MSVKSRNIIGPVVLLVANGALMIATMAAIFQRLMHVQALGAAAERFVLAGCGACALIGAAAAYALLNKTPSPRPALLHTVSTVMFVAAAALWVFVQIT